MKKKYSSLFLIINVATYAQIGINNSNPKTTIEVTALYPTGITNPQIKDGIIIPNIDRARAQAIGNNTNPVTPLSTLVYINNVVTGGATGSAINITAPGFYYFDTLALPAPGLWQPIRPTNIDIYGTQLIIPPHKQYIADFSNHSNATYDSNNWWVISKTSVNSATDQPARMTIVYEFQGTPFNINNLYPQLTAGNNSSYQDVYTANVISINNNGSNGKTRLTVSIARVDSYTGNWAGTFLLNTLLARKL